MLTKRALSTALIAACLAAPVAHAGLLGSVKTISNETPMEAGAEVPGRYILTLNPALPGLIGVDSLLSGVEALLVAVGGGEIEHLYQNAMTGAAVAVDPAQAAMLAAMPGVEAVEPDRIVAINGGVQANATWGLDRVDQRYLPLNESYQYPSSAGEGVNVYVIDTGIRASHTEFSGRVIEGRNFVPATGGGLLGGGLLGGGLLGGGFLFGGDSGEDDNATDTADCNGHGTHVASTAVGTVYGVAKGASVAAVRVLDCAGSGLNSNVIAGVDWVAANHVAPAVANMSLGGGNSDALDNAVRGAVSAGVTFVVAAGNDNVDACSGSPNRVAEAITVGSTTKTDARSSFSNYGTCVDIFAPGSSITAAWYDGDNQTNTISGTSMASPHVAGAAALVLGQQPQLSPAAVADELQSLGSANVLGGIGSGSPNLLLNIPQ